MQRAAAFRHISTRAVIGPERNAGAASQPAVAPISSRCRRDRLIPEEAMEAPAIAERNDAVGDGESELANCRHEKIGSAC